MKQFIRYLLLIVCLMVIGVWGWSYFSLAYINRYGATYIARGIIDNGNAIFLRIGNMTFPQDHVAWRSGIEEASSEMEVRNEKTLIKKYHFNYAGISIYDIKGGGNAIAFPIWLLFTPLLLLTLKLWYHPIKNWWRGKDQQGFPVEIRNDESNRNV